MHSHKPLIGFISVDFDDVTNWNGFYFAVVVVIIF